MICGQIGGEFSIAQPLEWWLDVLLCLRSLLGGTCRYVFLGLGSP